MGNASDDKNNRPVSDSLIQYVNSHLDLLFSFDDQYGIKSGIINLPEGPMLVAFDPITDSEFLTPASGVLLFGRYLNKALVDNIEQVVQAEVELMPADSRSIELLGSSAGEQNLLQKLKAGKASVIPIDNDKTNIYFFVNTLDNQSNLIAKLTTTRSIYRKGIQSFIFFFSVYVTLIFAMTILCLYFLQRYVVTPVVQLSSTIERIDLNSNRFSRLDVKSDDEIGKLAGEINNMLERIEQDNIRMINNERKLKQVFQASEAAYFDMNLLDLTIYLSSNLYAMLEYQPQEGYVSIDFWRSLLHEEDFENILKLLRNVPMYYSELQDSEFRLRNQAGNYKWFLIRSSIADYEQNGQPKRITGIIIDIDDKKKIEEELKYLSFHDKLTGI